MRKPRPRQRLRVEELASPVVSALRLFPGISPDLVGNVLRPPLQGLVPDAYAVGNGPDHGDAVLAPLTEATCRELVPVDCTQCTQGPVRVSQ